VDADPEQEQECVVAQELVQEAFQAGVEWQAASAAAAMQEVAVAVAEAEAELGSSTWEAVYEGGWRDVAELEERLQECHGSVLGRLGQLVRQLAAGI
jgi:hypothetical protein